MTEYQAARYTRGHKSPGGVSQERSARKCAKARENSCNKIIAIVGIMRTPENDRRDCACDSFMHAVTSDIAMHI